MAQMSIEQHGYINRAIRALELIAKELNRLNNFLESASAESTTEKTENKE